MVNAMYVQDVPKSAKTPEETLKLVKLTPKDIADAAQGRLKVFGLIRAYPSEFIEEVYVVSANIFLAPESFMVTFGR